MLEINIELNNNDLEDLNKVKNREGVFNKQLNYVLNKKLYRLGNLIIAPESIVDDKYQVQDRFYIINITLGSHKEEPLIKFSVDLKYIVVKENIDKTLFGEHLLVNTANGERIKFTVSKIIKENA